MRTMVDIGTMWTLGTGVRIVGNMCTVRACVRCARLMALCPVRAVAYLCSLGTLGCACGVLWYTVRSKSVSGKVLFSMVNEYDVSGFLTEIPSDGMYRSMDDLMPATRRVVEVINRSLNIQSVSKTVLLTGSPQTGRTYAVMTLADHLNDLTSTRGPRRMYRFSDRMRTLLSSKNLGEEDVTSFLANANSAMHLFFDSISEYPVLYADTLAEAYALSTMVSDIPLIAELSVDDASTFMRYHKDDTSSIDIINFDDLDTPWGDVHNELVHVDEAVFAQMYDSRFTPKQIESMLRLLSREITPVVPYKRSGLMMMPFGVTVDVLEHLHLKAIEKHEGGEPGPFTVSDSAFRKYVHEVIDEHPASPSSNQPEPQQNVIRISIPGITAMSQQTDDDDMFEMANEDDSGKQASPLMKYSDVHTLAERMRRKVIHQDEAIAQIVDAVKIDAAGLNEKTRPVASFLFTGPSGVGKTEVARVLAEELFESPAKMLRLDMSEYSAEHTVSKLFGSAPGYVNSDEGGQLTNFVMENPQSIILLDEAEKAHPKVWNSFLQVLDAGRMTDGRGVVADFSNTVIIMTSNLGNNENIKGKAGFGVGGELGMSTRNRERQKVTKKAYEKYFLPEFLGRIDAIIQFNQLDKNDMRKIIDIQMKNLSNVISENHPGYALQDKVDISVSDFLIDQSDTERYGARQLKKTIKSRVMLPLADYFIDNVKDDTATATTGHPSKGKARKTKKAPEQTKSTTLNLTLGKDDTITVTPDVQTA